MIMSVNLNLLKNKFYFVLGYKMKVDVFDILLFSGFCLSIVLLNKYVKKSNFDKEVYEICQTLNNVDILGSSETKEQARHFR